jgi:hypothetical protein
MWHVNNHAFPGTIYSWRPMSEHSVEFVQLDLAFLDIEPACGSWVWNRVGVYQPTPQSMVYTVATRTTTPDPYTGRDSLDFRYTLRNGERSDMFALSAGYHGRGYANQFFTPITFRSADDYSNPNMRARVRQFPHYPRTAKSTSGRDS